MASGAVRASRAVVLAAALVSACACAFASTTPAAATVRPVTNAQAVRFVRTFVAAVLRHDYVAACRMWSRAEFHNQWATFGDCVRTFRDANPNDSWWGYLRAGYRITKVKRTFVPESSCPDNACGPPVPAFWNFEMTFVSGSHTGHILAALMWEGSALRTKWVGNA